jgi:CRISPR-associated protein Cmr2
MKHLFLTGIGPVQDFIRQARRSRDLFYGSWLLSELSKAAAYAIAKEEGLDSLIFPAPETTADLEPGNERLTVANKVLAQIETETGKMGQIVQDAVQQRLQELWTATKQTLRSEIEEKVADQQIADLVEIFWVSAQRTGNYSQDRKLVEALLASRKNTRDFSPPTWSSNQVKSSLDGQRECVIPEANYATRGDDQHIRSFKTQLLFRNYGAGPAERLSGVDLLKRKGALPDGQEFPSTSHIAAMPFITALERRTETDAGVKQRLEAYITKLKNAGVGVDILSASFAGPLGAFDGSIFYPSRLTEGSTEENNVAATAHKEFMEALGHNGELNPYYAIMLADGDGMGGVIDAQQDVSMHRMLSKNLSRFAVAVPEIIKRHRGGLIYAGGDDVMAFIPLNSLLSCTKELATKYKEIMGQYQDEDGNPTTLSVGVAVGHFLDPMNELLDLARSAEQHAKRIKGKDALAITVSKRSGADRTISGKWGAIDSRLDDFVSYFQTGLIPSGVSYELLGLENDFPEVEGRERLSNAVTEEAIRIIKRKRSQAGTKELDSNVIDDLRQRLHECRSIREFSNELIIAHMIADITVKSQPSETTATVSSNGRDRE